MSRLGKFTRIDTSAALMPVDDMMSPRVLYFSPILPPYLHGVNNDKYTDASGNEYEYDSNLVGWVLLGVPVNFQANTVGATFAAHPETVMEPVKLREGCSHVYKYYEGILERYHYCEYCDHKKAVS